jgi:hypothetical protein
MIEEGHFESDRWYFAQVGGIDDALPAKQASSTLS